MRANKWLIGFVIIASGLLGWTTIRDIPNLKKVDAIATMFAPGPMSKSHQFLENQCSSCHASQQGVSSVGCISCHANNVSLLQRQSTSFHSNITTCKECHQEHLGGAKPPLLMDHLALATIGMKAHGKNPKDVDEELISVNLTEAPLVSTLNCMSCHATRDRHQGFFGSSCLSCHSSQTWQIADYKHPSPNSRSCVQCHQAPPSHYMMHFEMVSKKVAGHGGAKVNQCFLCHQTTSWNDIKGKGWYKHH